MLPEEEEPPTPIYLLLKRDESQALSEEDVPQNHHRSLYGSIVFSDDGGFFASESQSLLALNQNEVVAEIYFNSQRISKWSSNIFFLTGSILYVLLASWALSTPDSDDDGSSSKMHAACTAESVFDPASYTPLICLEILAATCYFFDATSEMCSHYTPKHKRPSSVVEAPSRLRLDGFFFEIAGTTSFAIAAVVEIVSSMFATDECAEISEQLELISNLVYLINAILILVAKSYPNELSPMVACVSSMGDALFLVGSMIDCSLSLVKSHPMVSEHMVNQGSMVSALLWFTDALLYGAAELMTYGQARQVVVLKVQST